MKFSRQFHSRAFEGLAWTALGRIVGKTDAAQRDVAEEQIRQGISLLEQLEARAMYATGYLVLVELFADAGEKASALENLRKAEALCREMRAPPQSYWLARVREASEGPGQRSR